MRPVEALLCVLCVVLVSAGQVLLRAAALAAQRAQASGLLAWCNGITVVALLVYVTAMALWVWILGRVPATQAFAFFGLCFFLVPLFAHRFLGDPVSIYTWLGAGVIAAGIVLANLRPA